jgi:hypothetical protein
MGVFGGAVSPVPRFPQIQEYTFFAGCVSSVDAR